MKYRCIRARADLEAGEVVEVPDGAAVSPLYFEPVTAAAAKPAEPVKDGAK